MTKILSDLAAYHSGTDKHLRQLADAVKKGDKAKEKELQAQAPARQKQQKEALDRFEAYCEKHGLAAKS